MTITGSPQGRNCAPPWTRPSRTIQKEGIQEGDTVDVRYLYGSEALADQEGLPVSVRMVSVHLAD